MAGLYFPLGCPPPPSVHKIYSFRKTGKFISHVWRSEIESCEWSLILRKNRPWKLLSFACGVSLSVVTSRIVSLQQSYLKAFKFLLFFFKSWCLYQHLSIFKFHFFKKNDIAVWFCSSFILTSFTFFCVYHFTPKPILPCCDLGIGKGAVVQYSGTHLTAYMLIKWRTFQRRSDFQVIMIYKHTSLQ